MLFVPASFRTMWRACLLSLLVMGAVVTADTAIVPSHEAYSIPELLAKPVLKWTVHDVETWMNNTLGYPEYSMHIRKHLIDGPTLLEMSGADFENYFPVSDPLHAIKFSAHIKLLRGTSACNGDAGASSRLGFWGYLKKHKQRTLIEGITALYFPRTAMLMTYFADRPLYLALVQSQVGQDTELTRAERDVVQKARLAEATPSSTLLTDRSTSRLRRMLFWVSLVVAPDLYLAYQVVYLLPRNYIVLTLTFVHFLQQAYSEYGLFCMLLRKTAFEPGLSLWQKIWRVYSYVLFFPFIGALVSVVFPYVLQCVVVGLVIINNVILLLGWLMLIMEEIFSALGNGRDDAAATKSEKDGAATESTQPAKDASDTHSSAAAQNEKVD